MPKQQTDISEELKRLWDLASIAQKREFARFIRHRTTEKLRNACASVADIMSDPDRQSH